MSRKWIWVLQLILFSRIGQEALMGNSVFLDLQDFCMGLQYATLIQDINAQKQQIVKYLYTWFFFSLCIVHLMQSSFKTQNKRSLCDYEIYIAGSRIQEWYVSWCSFILPIQFSMWRINYMPKSICTSETQIFNWNIIWRWFQHFSLHFFFFFV